MGNCGRFTIYKATRYCLRVVSRDSKGNIVSACCQLCDTYGIETKSEDSLNRRRDPNSFVKTYSGDSFYVSNLDSHCRTDHPQKYAEYLELWRVASLEIRVGDQAIISSEDSCTKRLENFFVKKGFFGDRTAGNNGNTIIISNPEIVTGIIYKLFFPNSEFSSYGIVKGEKTTMNLFAPNYDNLTENPGSTDEPAPSSFSVRVKDLAAYEQSLEFMAESFDFEQIETACRIGRHGKNFFTNLKGVSTSDVSLYARAHVAVSLDGISELMKPVWTYSFAFDISTDKKDRSILDIRARIPIDDYTDICELHVIGSPVYNDHTGGEIKTLVSTCFESLDPNWKKIISCSTDGAASNTGHVKGAVTLIEQLVNPGMYRMWCAAHQLNILAQGLYNGIKLFEIRFNFIETLDFMTAECIANKALLQLPSLPPRRAATRWASTYRTISWHTENYCLTSPHFSLDHNEKAPKDLFWVFLFTAKDFFEELDVVITLIQGKQTQVCQVDQQIVNLRNFLIERCHVSESPSGAPYEEKVHSIDLPGGETLFRYNSFTVTYSVVESKVLGENEEARIHYEKLDENQKFNCIFVIAQLFLKAIHSLDNMSTLRDSYNQTHFTNLPVFPQHFAKMSPSEFMALVDRHAVRIDATLGEKWRKHDLKNSHKSLIRVYENGSLPDPEIISIVNKKYDSFKDAWKDLGNKFRDLRIFAAGLATAMPTTAQVEGDFSSINYERSQYRQSLLNITLEGILHSKQYIFLSRILNRLRSRKRKREKD